MNWPSSHRPYLRPALPQPGSVSGMTASLTRIRMYWSPFGATSRSKTKRPAKGTIDETTNLAVVGAQRQHHRGLAVDEQERLAHLWSGIALVLGAE
jgi:hypothetical protein